MTFGHISNSSLWKATASETRLPEVKKSFSCYYVVKGCPLPPRVAWEEMWNTACVRRILRNLVSIFFNRICSSLVFVGFGTYPGIGRSPNQKIPLMSGNYPWCYPQRRCLPCRPTMRHKEVLILEENFPWIESKRGARDS